MGSSLTTSSAFWILTTAQGWLVLELTDSAFWVGTIAFILGLPALFLCPFGGLYADRFDRRKLLILGQGASVILTLLLATLVSTGVAQIWHIAAISVLLGIAWGLTDPSYVAIISNLVMPDELMDAIAVDSLCWQLGRFIGPAIAGVLLGLVGMGGTFYGGAMSFVLGFVLLLPMVVPARATTRQASAGKTLQEGLKYVRSNTVALTIILMAASVSLFALPYVWLMPVFARDVLGVGELGYSQLMMATGAGGFGGAIAAAKLGDIRRKGWLLIGSALTFMASLLLFAVSPVFSLSLVLAVIISGVNGVFQAVTTALVLSVVPDHFRGRVMGLFIITWYLPSVGSFVLGAAIDRIGFPGAVVTGALICTAIIFGVILRVPALRRL